MTRVFVSCVRCPRSVVQERVYQTAVSVTRDHAFRWKGDSIESTPDRVVEAAVGAAMARFGDITGVDIY